MPGTDAKSQGVFMKLDLHEIRRLMILSGLLALPMACTAGDQTAGAADSATAEAPAAAPSAEVPAEPAQTAPAPAEGAAPPAATASGDKPYSVECGPDPESGEQRCLVDKQTYIGWRTFNSVCYVCHGQDAVGTTFAPSLIERLQVIDKARFMDVVQNGFQGQIGVMPPWKDNPNVNTHFEELYSYVKARSDGALPSGRPQRKPE
jgi:mono/diheme cytochrome c family protein